MARLQDEFRSHLPSGRMGLRSDIYQIWVNSSDDSVCSGVEIFRALAEHLASPAQQAIGMLEDHLPPLSHVLL